jgi:ribosomal protein S27AE
MSQQKDFGVECKNQKCRCGIILGDHMRRPKTKDDAIVFISVKAGKLTCPTCGETHDYGQNDLRDFGVPGI